MKIRQQGSVLKKQLHCLSEWSSVEVNRKSDTDNLSACARAAKPAQMKQLNSAVYHQPLLLFYSPSTATLLSFSTNVRSLSLSLGYNSFFGDSFICYFLLLLLPCDLFVIRGAFTNLLLLSAEILSFCFLCFYFLLFCAFLCFSECVCVILYFTTLSVHVLSFPPLPLSTSAAPCSVRPKTRCSG